MSVIREVADLQSFVAGCVAGATFAWAFAQRTSVKYAKERIVNLVDQAQAAEENCQAEKTVIREEYAKRTEELKGYYKETVDRLEDEMKRLRKQVDTLQDHRLQMAILVDKNDIVDGE
jgi:gas vesicle protein